LALAAECPEQFLSKVLQNLTRAGIIVSRRGNTGGFELPAENRNVTVLDVVEAIEGPVRLNACLISDNSCVRQGWCPTHATWQVAQQAMCDVLRQATIGGLAATVATNRAAV
jgi:Rrf2 family protein